MGLAAPKNKIKLSHDPNNTRWTNDTSSFGLKIMTSQGWQPGQYLGAQDAAHAEFHTAANASHIRVSIKDDNLGLGAKTGSGVGHGECTGLDAFKNLLGRLNGKDEDEIAKEQKSRDELRVAIYSERKWGSTRFVSGGFLIGDKIQHLIEAEAERVRKMALGSSSESSSDSSSDSEEEEKPLEKSKKSKKRKVEVLEEPEVVGVKVERSKKERKANAKMATKDTSESSEAKVSKKSKKDRKSKSETDDNLDEAELKRRRKQEKKEKKERKEKAKAEADTSEEEPKKKKKSKKDKHKEAADSSESSLPVTKESTPAVTESSGRSTPIMMQGRHAVRARNIAQKRMASMDIASLNQIFMIKS